GLVVRASALDALQLGPSVDLHLVQIRTGRNESYRAALGACTEERTLRSAKHLDALEIADQWIGRGGGHSDHPDLDRSIVDVDAGRGRSDRRADSAYGHIGLMTVAARRSSEGKPGRYSGDVVDAANVQG